VVVGGQPRLSTDFQAGRFQDGRDVGGYPIKSPVIDLIEIGAGGGSIARLDAFGVLKVGPESAGADPGPACYGRGGDKPTVTDAHVALGHIAADGFGSEDLDPRPRLEMLDPPVTLLALENRLQTRRVINGRMRNVDVVSLNTFMHYPRRFVFWN